MATKSNALAAARKRWGKDAFVREHRRALTATQRQERRSLVKSMNDRLRELEKELKCSATAGLKLLEASEFFLSVNGDEPSGSHFREAVAASRHIQDCREERDALIAERDRIHGGCHSYRWDAGYIFNIGDLGSAAGVHAHGDTLDELIANIRELSESASIAATESTAH